MTHDPLCWFADPAKTPAVAVNDGWPCICDLIASVRTDERGRNAYVISGPESKALMLSETLAPIAEGAYRKGYAAALRDAVEAVKALYDHHDADCDDLRCEGPDREFAIAAIEALGGQQ